jgi:glutamine phosphoribosylpyrophosphate amidotransferase
MCGLFAWLAPTEDCWDYQLAESAVRGAASRGPHGWGVARFLPVNPPEVAASTLVMRKPGAMLDGERLRYQPAPGIVVGHCRLATSGGPSGYTDLAAIQPLNCGGLAVAHNGNVRNASDLISKYELRPRTNNDSEILGLLLAWVWRGGGDILQETATMLNEVSPGDPLACLVLLPDGRVLAASRGLPLHTSLYGPALYISSRTMRDSAPMPRDSAMLCTWHSRRADWKCAPLDPYVASHR